MNKANKKKVLVVLFLVLLTFILTGCRTQDDTVAIPNNFKDLFGGSLWDFLAWPMAKLLYFIGKYLVGGNYGVALIITTIIIRTIAWPIYAKTNDMSLKMQLMDPEVRKIEEKYEGRNDDISLRNKQLELAQLYRKYGIGLGGCLLPFFQLPIFIAFYSVVRRVQATPWLKEALTFRFLGIDLSIGRDGGTKQAVAVYIFAALVGLTQIGSQILMNYRQKKMKESAQANVPEYRRKTPTEQQMQTEKMMKFMLYGLTVMMVLFVISSPAGLGLYWLIGNIYSTLQSTISHKLSGRRLEQLRKKHSVI
ncbi:MAG TPA: YidC/Oxa1 family membrane protein insertase [Bacilli bacterium]|nr:YidC/Oxa1 family membrane protein insertase [Bacilli bacterium]HPT88885.1 YidC/Oxa1 family membrane protein insertase [Bacilli bacterium]